MLRAPSKTSTRVGRKKGSYGQARRVIALYDALLGGATLRSPEVAAEYGISERQAQRDLEALKEVFGERLTLRPDGAWHLPREQKRAYDKAIVFKQVLAVELGAKLSAFLWGPEDMRSLHTRIDNLRQELGLRIEARFHNWRRRVAVIAPGQKDYSSREDLAGRFVELLEAMIETRPVTIEYRSHRRAISGKPSRRFLAHPLGVVFYRDGVYFVVDVVKDEDGASAKLVGERILLALDRILDVECGPWGGFQVPRDFDTRDFFAEAFGIWREGAPLDVVVEIDPAHAPYAKERVFHPSQQIEERTDGSLVVRLRASGMTELSDWIVSFGEHAEVVEPKELRDHVKKRLFEAAERYR